MSDHCPMVYREGTDHFWLTCCDWRHDPASNDPDDGVRWAEWQAALQEHLATPPSPTHPGNGSDRGQEQ